MTVPLRDVRVDVTHECADGLERRTANGLAREDTEPRLDHVQPGCAFRGEVKLNLRMLGEPGLHGRRRMRRGVVEHDVQAAPAIAAPARRFMKPKKSAPVCCAAQFPVTRPLANLEGGVQAGQPVPAIVMRLPRRQAGRNGSKGCVRLNAWICVFSSRLSTTALVGGLR